MGDEAAVLPLASKIKTQSFAFSPLLPGVVKSLLPLLAYLPIVIYSPVLGLNHLQVAFVFNFDIFSGFSDRLSGSRDSPSVELAAATGGNSQ